MKTVVQKQKMERDDRQDTAKFAFERLGVIFFEIAENTNTLTGINHDLVCRRKKSSKIVVKK